jgi:hypothetical protein
MNPLCAKNFKTDYNVVPYGDHGTERVNMSATVIYWLFNVNDSPYQ